jgi:predicted lipid-binding transport protein (Tim44 family)
MTSFRYTRRLMSVLAIGVVLSASLAGVAEARRGGGFGSRGLRTYSAPAATYASPYGAAPIQRSMTPQTPGQGMSGTFQPYAAPSPFGAPYQPPFSQRFGGGLVSGLLMGGLIGGLMGHGFGGGYGGGAGVGLFSLIFQLAALGLIGWFVLRLFRGRGRADYAGEGFQPAGAANPFAGTAFGFQPAGPAAAFVPAAAPVGGDEIGVGPADRATFERLLGEVQAAFGREDYGALRTLVTPEVMSFLAEEMSDNATHGRKNDVTGVRLLSQALSEAWREGDADYATVALRYESVDVMRDRQTGAVTQGDPSTPTETTEIWTFARKLGGPEAGVWKLSAIQDAR